MSNNLRTEITLDIVERLQPGATVWDTKVTGFCVRCQKKSKVYGLKYRVNGRQRYYTIGKHGAPFTARSARDTAKVLLAEIAKGNDPSGNKQARKVMPTMEQVARIFMEEHGPHLAERSAAEYQRVFDKLITPKLGKLLVSDVTYDDIAKLHHSLRSKPVAANRVLAILSKLFNTCEFWQLRPEHSNPCRHVKKYPETPRTRMLTAAEIGRLGIAFNEYDGSPYIVAALKLLMFTGARKNEILKLRWSDINFELGEARISEHKTSRAKGAKTIQLPPPAIDVLRSIGRIDGNEFVIVGGVVGASLVNLQKPWNSIRGAAGLADVRLHDLRHCFGGVAASSGTSLQMIGKMLGQSQPQTTMRYAHLLPDPVKSAAAAVAGTIAQSLTKATIKNG